MTPKLKVKTKNTRHSVTSGGQINDLSQLVFLHLTGNIITDEVIVRDAYKEENSIVIKWDTDTSNILGFRIVYRLFGKPEFKQGPPLAPSEREFRIKNVPSNVSVVFFIRIYTVSQIKYGTFRPFY